MLELQSFRKSYREKEIISIPGLYIPEGIHWIRGKNGSGKSTLFRCIAGISPFQGSVILKGKYDLKKNPADYRLRVNFAEAEPLYPGFLSGKEILEFAAEAKKTSPGQLDDIIRRLSLGLYFENPAATYSSGMAKKIAVALAFLGNPDLILLDEPFITLDQESCTSVEEMISESVKKGSSVLLSSHTDLGHGLFGINQCWEVNSGQLHSVPCRGV